METIFDAAIIGGGVTGAAAAYRLTHCRLKVALLEKENDVCRGVSKANSGIVHGGFHYSAEKTLKGRLEVRGNQMFDELSEELHFPFQRCGILVVAYLQEQLETVRQLYQQGLANHVPGIELCSKERILELEPKLPDSVCGGLYAPGGGVVEPYSLVFAMIHAAELNDLVLQKNFRAASGIWTGKYWEITASDGRSLRARNVINAAGLFADEVSRAFGAEEFRILPRKGEEYLLDRQSPARPSKVIFPVPSPHSKGVLVIPTAGGTTMIGPTAEIVEDKLDTGTSEENRTVTFARARTMVSGISERDLITSFSGCRPVLEGKEDFYIDLSRKIPHFIQAAGIQSPGLTAAPAVAERIEQLLKETGLALLKKEKFILPKSTPSLREMDAKTADRFHDLDPEWTNIICRCEKVSEAEIRRAIRQGHTTIDGIKLATRAGMGRCQGGFCTLKIMHILADECRIPLEEVLKREKDSRIAVGRIGDTREEQNR